MPVPSLLEYERVWVDGLNRGDASAADKGRGDSHGAARAGSSDGKKVAIDGLIVGRVVGGRCKSAGNSSISRSCSSSLASPDGYKA